jgi:uncharacterized protein
VFFLRKCVRYIYWFVGNIGMDKEVIKRVILKYGSLVPNDIVPRQLVLEQSKLDKAITIIGPRRAGKSYYLYSVLEKTKKPVFLNFEDNLLQGIKAEDLELIKDSAKELFGSEELTYFFDEIQEVDDWENFIVTLINEHVKVYLSGSNSKLLSMEISTSLRGKSLPYLIMPFSFREFLGFKKVKVDDKSLLTDKVFEIKKLFKEYLDFGGFPEIVATKELSLKARLIASYYDSIIYKDLVDRLKMKNTELVKILINYTLSNYASMFSISQLEKHLKITKTPYSLEDVYLILDSLKDIFFTFYVKQYSRSFKKTRLSKAKVYLVDNAYIQFLSRDPGANGRKLENTVFVELFRRAGNVENKNIFYFIGKNECDFVVEEQHSKQLIQVCYNLDENSRQREIDGLSEAMTFFKKKNGLIITFDQEEEIILSDKIITVKPVWKWLLE